ncbi:hypothetical protein [Lysobacter sp. FW306-1B-D06B]|uniref:hypothetical protein n=1 Tax=Lysobacter sp. FW306-1B-D06B TaxID=3140250 RepID=UPI00314029A5
MSNLVPLQSPTTTSAPPAVIPSNPDRRYVDVIEQNLREAYGQEPEVMLSIFARVIDQHLANTLRSTGRRPWLDQALDDVLAMIPLKSLATEKGDCPALKGAA